MTQSDSSRGLSPDNVLWALLSLVAVVSGSLVICRSVQPAADLEAKKAEHRIEVRKKILADEVNRLTVLDWADKAKGLVKVPLADFVKTAGKELGNKKPVASSVKVDAPLPSLGGDAPALPSAPGGAQTVQFPKLVAPGQLPVPVPPQAPAAPPADAPVNGLQAPAAPAPASAAPAPAAPGNPQPVEKP